MMGKIMKKLIEIYMIYIFLIRILKKMEQII